MQGDFNLENIFVAVFNVLGQRETLRGAKGISSSGEDKEEHSEVVRESIGKLAMLRDAFSRFFDEAQSHTLKTADVPTQFRAEFLESQKASYSFHGLSDAFVISIPLTEVNENSTAMMGVHAAIAATCGIGLLALFLGVPARGGIDIGIGVRLKAGEIYGPALERALRLESRFSEYPRFLAGAELISYLGWVRNGKYSTYLGRITQDISESCRTIVTRDTDGRDMLDFLGKGVKEVLVNSIDKEVIDGARRFVETQYRKHVADENEKLASRYYRLLRYFESRKNVWEQPRS